MAKISWSKALVDYLKDEVQSYASIASKYGVSLQAVKKRAGKEGWQDLRQKSIQKVNQELPELVGESMAKTNARHIQMAISMQTIAVEAIKKLDTKSITYSQALQSVKIGIEIERKARGMDIKDNREDKFTRVEAFIEESRKKYGFGKYSEESKKVITPIQPIKKEFVFSDTLPPVQSNQRVLNIPTSVLTPEFLEGIQMQLKKVQDGFINLENKINTPTTVQPEAGYGWLNRN